MPNFSQIEKLLGQSQQLVAAVVALIALIAGLVGGLAKGEGSSAANDGDGSVATVCTGDFDYVADLTRSAGSVRANQATLQNKLYPKTLFTLTNDTGTYKLNGTYSTFKAVVGNDGAKQNAALDIYFDGKRVKSVNVKGSSTPQTVAVAVPKGAKTIRLDISTTYTTNYVGIAHSPCLQR